MPQPVLKEEPAIISDTLLDVLHTVFLVVIAASVAAFGIMANIINIVVFLKQGLVDSVNISLLGLAVSDLCSLVTLEWVNLLRNPFFSSRVPFLIDEVQYLSAAWPHACFARITSWITVYITMERCLCVLIPLHVKRIVKPKFALCAIMCIFLVMSVTLVPDYATCYLGWKFDEESNRSLVGLMLLADGQNIGAISFNLSACTQISSFGAVIFFTNILVFKMKQQSKWRSSAAQLSANTSTVTNKRDNKTVKMIILIASVYCVCYLPMVINFTITCIEPEFIVEGRYNNAFMAAWAFGFMMDSINSTVNILVYYFMSTKYRTTFHNVILKKRATLPSDKS